MLVEYVKYFLVSDIDSSVFRALKRLRSSAVVPLLSSAMWNGFTETLHFFVCV